VGGDLGQNLSVSFSGVALTFTSWTRKLDEGGYVGFTFAASSPVAYAVKAGLQTHYSTETSWTHPAGLSGPYAKAISNITLCPGAPADGGVLGGGGGAPCAVDTDCWSGECRLTTHVCAPGGVGTRCEDGSRDCASRLCSDGVCAPNPTGQRGDPCTVPNECWSGGCVNNQCEGGATGEGCRDANDCRVGLVCNSNVCGPN
jgi:hypothetical protein